MKRVFILSASLVLGSVIGLLGVHAPQRPLLPNFDKRLDAAKAGDLPAPKKAAAERLNHSLPHAQLSVDPILKAPHFVSDPTGFLTAPRGQGGKGLSAESLAAVPQNDPHRLAKAFLKEHSALFGYGDEVLQTAQIKTDYVDAHNGLRTVIWQQELDGIPVFEGLLKTHLTKNDELVNLSSHLIAQPAQAADKHLKNRATLQKTPAISARKAVVLAAQSIGDTLAEEHLSQKNQPAGPHFKQQLKALQGLKNDIYLELNWVPVDDTSLTLCWNVMLTSRSRNESFLVLVDAATGELWLRKMMTRYISDASYRVYTSDSPSPFTPGLATPGTNQPAYIPRVLVVTNAFSTNASPLGWIPDGTNTTVGNNVQAATDINGDDQPDLPRPQGNPNRVFDFPYDPTQEPTNFPQAAVVQLFYLANAYHDLLYNLGFTEAAGNYQTTNFGRGGLENDAVIAEAQDPTLQDNAAFTPAPDGTPGRMEVGLWTPSTPMRDQDFDAETIYHEMTHGVSDRLIGGGAGLTYSAQSGGLSEAWSDWFAETLLSEPADNVDGNYPFSAWPSLIPGLLTENYYYGIRRYPYSTDMTKNPLTYKDIDPTQASAHAGIPLSPLFSPFDPSSADEVHNAGEVWCVTMWEVRAAIVKKWGWSIGNQMILQLAIDAMKLAPVDPDYLQMRDAVIQADLVDNGGANSGEMWAAFAKRGLGGSATSPGSYTCIGVTEAFDFPGLTFKDGWSVDTFTGNGNGVIDINECNEIMVSLVNYARTKASNVTAVLTTTTPDVIMSQGSSPYIDIAPGAIVTNLVPFKIYTRPTFVCGTPIQFALVVYSSLDVRTNVFSLPTGRVGDPLRFDNSTVMPIPDMNATGIDSPIVVSGINSAIAKVTVSLYIQHTFDGDLTFDLIGPDGTRVTLSDQNGFGANFGMACAPDAQRTTFDDKALISITAGMPPFPGSYKPEQTLSAFNGKSGAAANGTWRLHLVDGFILGVGSLECWSLDISPTVCAEGTGDCSTDLAISGSYSPALPIVGSNLTFNVLVTNQGPNSAREVVMTDTLPAGMTVLSALSTQGRCAAQSNQVVCNIGSLTNSGTASINITVRSSLAGVCTNIATVTSGTPDLNSLDNTSILVLEVLPPRPIIVSAGTRLVSESLLPANGGIDPNETVGINFAFKNVGALSTLNLVATLLNTNGVIAASAPKLYGILDPGGPAVTNQFTFTAAGTNGGSIQITFQLQDGTNNLGYVTIPYSLSGVYGFSNQSVIIIRDNTNANPYPCPIYVSGVSGGVLRKVTATLFNINHNNPEQIDVLLVGPGGANVFLMSDVGLYSTMTNVTLTFQDGGQALPRMGQVLSGTYSPTNYTRGANDDNFLPPAPLPPYGTTLSVFNGSDPNGVWELYVMDDTLGEAGRISSGWALNLYMVDYVNPTPDLAVLASATPASLMVGDTITCNITVTNQGPDTATGVILTNILPLNCTFVSATNSVGGACVNNGRGVSCQLGILTNLGQARVTITAVAGLASTATNSGVISNYVRVSTSDLDPNLSNNSTAVLATVNPLADLALSLQAVPSPATIGQDLTYVLAITNAGPNIASGVMLTNRLPAGVTFISANPDRGSCSQTNGVVVCSLGSLNPASRAAATIIIRGGLVGVLTNTAYVAAAQPLDPVLTNNSAQVVTLVNNPNLIINPAGAVMLAENSLQNSALDSGETVTLAFGLVNAGISNTANLVATLLPGNGVANPSAPRSYGALVGGGAAKARAFTFTVNGASGASVTAILQLNDGTNNLGTASFNFVIGLSGQFANASPAVIPDLGTATVYPSVIVVSNLVGVIEKATVTVSNLSHTYPADIDMLLVGPSGQNAILMSDAGGGASINNVTLTFDDAAAASLPQNGPITSGAYKPTNFGSTPDIFPAPAPDGPYGSLLSAFIGAQPNGAWSLYIVDDTFGDAGSWTGGWTLALTTAGRVETVSPTVHATMPVVVLPNGQIQLSVQGTSGADYVILGSSDLKTWTPVGTNAVDNGSSILIDPNPGQPAYKFYRATLHTP